MSLADIMALCPDAAEIMTAYGLHCFSCSMGGAESLHDGCMLHGFDDETIDALIEDLNVSVRSQQPRPATIVFSPNAIQALGEIVSRDKLPHADFVILIDAMGDFALEPHMEFSPDEQICFCAEECTLRVFAAPLVLWRWGGSTVTYRDERFILQEVLS